MKIFLYMAARIFGNGVRGRGDPHSGGALAITADDGKER
jgi:hypothetical protein